MMYALEANPFYLMVAELREYSPASFLATD